MWLVAQPRFSQGTLKMIAAISCSTSSDSKGQSCSLLCYFERTMVTTQSNFIIDRSIHSRANLHVSRMRGRLNILSRPISCPSSTMWTLWKFWGVLASTRPHHLDSLFKVSIGKSAKPEHLCTSNALHSISTGWPTTGIWCWFRHIGAYLDHGQNFTTCPLGFKPQRGTWQLTGSLLVTTGPFPKVVTVIYSIEIMVESSYTLTLVLR